MELDHVHRTGLQRYHQVQNHVIILCDVVVVVFAVIAVSLFFNICLTFFLLFVYINLQKSIFSIKSLLIFRWPRPSMPPVIKLESKVKPLLLTASSIQPIGVGPVSIDTFTFNESNLTLNAVGT